VTADNYLAAVAQSDNMSLRCQKTYFLLRKFSLNNSGWLCKRFEKLW